MKKLKNKQPEKLVKTEKKYGDYPIISGAMKSSIWKAFLTNWDTAFVLLIKYWFSFTRGMINYSFCNVFRSNAGINQSGIIISLMSCLFITSINSSEIWLLTKGLGAFYIPISIFWKSKDEMIEMVITNRNSTILFYYNILLIATSLISICKMYLGRTDQEDLSSRGTSKLFLLTKWVFKKLKIRRIKPRRQFFEGTLEPIILIATGILLYRTDIYAAVFFLLMALSEITIQVTNIAATLKKKTLINA